MLGDHVRVAETGLQLARGVNGTRAKRTNASASATWASARTTCLPNCGCTARVSPPALELGHARAKSCPALSVGWAG